eukprot:3147741-Rhodomonas_salina.1
MARAALALPAPRPPPPRLLAHTLRRVDVVHAAGAPGGPSEEPARARACEGRSRVCGRPSRRRGRMPATCLRRRALSGAMSASSSCGRRWGSLCACFPMRCVVETKTLDDATRSKP